MNNLQKTSRGFKWLFILCMIALPLTLLCFWVNAPATWSKALANMGFNISYMPQLPHNISTPQTLSIFTKFVAFCISLIPLTIQLCILGFLVQLFANFEQMVIFSLENVRTIKRIGYTLLIGQLIAPIHEMLLDLAITWHNPPHQRMISITFDGTNIAILFTAIMVIIISWIMAEGHKLQQEQQFTI